VVARRADNKINLQLVGKIIIGETTNRGIVNQFFANYGLKFNAISHKGATDADAIELS